MRKNTESGSALIMIFIAVGLFAALTYAFSSSNRNNVTLITETEADAYATQIINYGNEVKSAVKRLQLRGCSDTEISFENNEVTGYTNPNAPTNKKCHVFDIAGGGINYKNIANNIIDSDASAKSHYGQSIFMIACPVGVGTDLSSSGSECNTATNTLAHGDLIFVSPYIKREVCEAINRRMANSNSIPTDVNNSYYAAAQFEGDFEIVTAQSIKLGSPYENTKSACYTDNGIIGNDNYAFFTTLIAR